MGNFDFTFVNRLFLAISKNADDMVKKSWGANLKENKIDKRE